jgi:uncharacterized protein
VRLERIAVSLCLAILIPIGGTPPLSAGDWDTLAPPVPYTAEIARFRHERTAELTADDGWLTVAGLFWLKPGANVAGSAPGSDILLPSKAPAKVGVFELSGGRVVFRPDPSARVTVAGKPLGLAAIDAPVDDAPPLAVGDLRMFIIQREDRFGIRMRDLKNAARTGFAGLTFYPVRPSYRIRARFVPYDPPKQVLVPNVLGQAPEMTSPGYVTFVLNGRPLRLEPVYETDERKDLFFIFKDETSRDTTYPAGRFLHASLPRNRFVTLDFNKAYNPPCAFTDFATCPLPTKANRLPVRIEAGERAYHLHPR